MKDLVTIADLANRHFQVPAYQRGYKWGRDEVRQLLDDIEDFRTGDVSSGFYCLQPVIVRRKVEDMWELIDGQQRLTTIYLILRYLHPADGCFSLEYETRPHSRDFLKRIVETWNKSWDEVCKNAADNNSDCFHCFHAFQAIHDWFQERQFQDLDHMKWSECFKSKIQIIWHEIQDTDSEEAFIRLNSGRIPLSGGDLIKALFLRVADTDGADKLRLPARYSHEIGAEWEAIESALHEPSFWAFLNPEKEFDTDSGRIVCLFDLVLRGELNSTPDEPPGTAEFRHYSELIVQGSFDRDSEWLRIWNCFQTLQEWQADRDVFHAVGFLRARENQPLPELWRHSRGISKGEFREWLAKEVQKKLSSAAPDQLNFHDHYKEIHLLLLWFNIRCVPAYARFPFEHYTGKAWSLEHIHAQNTEELEGEVLWPSWLSSMRGLEQNHMLLGEDLAFSLQNKLKEADGLKSGDRRRLIEEVSELLAPGLKGNDLHGICNLALLEGGDNSSLSNGIFLEKRQKVMEWHHDGKFIPPATREVFLKGFGGDLRQMLLWTKPDRTAYMEAIKQVLAKPIFER